MGRWVSQSRTCSPTSIVSEFTCKICCNLVEYGHAAYTHCSHVFCESCLADWVARSSDPEVLAEAAMNGEPARGPRCPTCNAGLAGEGKVAPLQTQPLAWRLLGRVQVRCPLHDSTSCGWRGDLSEVSAHLTNSEPPQRSGLRPEQRHAERGGAQEPGQRQVPVPHVREAIQLYSKAISAAPGVASYYGNRAAAWLMVGAAQECAEDCKRAIQLDSGYVKGYVRLAKALVELSDVDGAEPNRFAPHRRDARGKKRSRRNSPGSGSSARTSPRANARCTRTNPRGRWRCSRRRRVVQCAAVTLGAARAEIALGRCDGATSATGAVIRAATRERPRVRRARARAVPQAGLRPGREAHPRGLTSGPRSRGVRGSVPEDETQAMRAAGQGRTASSKRDFEAAREAAHGSPGGCESADALAVHRERPRAARQRPTSIEGVRRVFGRLRGGDRVAVEDHKPAYFTQATALLHLGKPQEAEESLAVLLKMDPGDETVRRHHEKAAFEVRKSKRRITTPILGISRVASVPEVKQAYKARCMEWHPDRHANSSDEGEGDRGAL